MLLRIEKNPLEMKSWSISFLDFEFLINSFSDSSYHVMQYMQHLKKITVHFVFLAYK